MIQECPFDPLRDVEQVVPGLSVDVGEIMTTHRVVSTGDTSPYTKETETKSVGHYLTDKIQTAMAAYRLGKSMSQAASAPAPTKESNPEGAK